MTHANPTPDIDRLLEIIIGIVLGAVVCLILGSCRSTRTITDTRHTVTHDTVTVRAAATSDRHDSTFYRELVRIVPRIITVGDTQIVTTDTTITRYRDRLVFHTVTDTAYRDRILTTATDSSFVAAYNRPSTPTGNSEALSPPITARPRLQPTTTGHRWRSYWLGILSGILLSILFTHRRQLLSFIRRLITKT